MIPKSLTPSQYNPVDIREWAEEDYLFTHVLEEDRFCLDDYPHRRMLNQNLGPTTRLMKLRRPHKYQDYILQLKDVYAFVFPVHSRVSITDQYLRRYGAMDNNHYYMLGPGTYHILGQGMNSPFFDCCIVRFTKRDLPTWVEEGLMPYGGKARRKEFESIFCGECHSRIKGHNVNLHFALFFFLLHYLQRIPTQGILDFLRNGPMEGEPLPESKASHHYQDDIWFAEFVERFRKRRKIKGMNENTPFEEITTAIKEMNLFQLRKHYPKALSAAQVTLHGPL